MNTDNEFFSVINRFAGEVHKNARDKGFHPEEPILGFIKGTVANIHGEVSEFWEAARAGNLYNECDKADKMVELGLTPLTCAEEELADIVIRVFDTAKRLNIDIGRSMSTKHAYNITRPHMHGGKLA